MHDFLLNILFYICIRQQSLGFKIQMQHIEYGYESSYLSPFLSTDAASGCLYSQHTICRHIYSVHHPSICSLSLSARLSVSPSCLYQTLLPPSLPPSRPTPAQILSHLLTQFTEINVHPIQTAIQVSVQSLSFSIRMYVISPSAHTDTQQSEGKHARRTPIKLIRHPLIIGYTRWLCTNTAERTYCRLS